MRYKAFKMTNATNIAFLLGCVLATLTFISAQNQNCRPNEIYTECGSCEATCDNPQPMCTMMCRPAGCYCPGNFVRNANGDCVPASSCGAKVVQKRQAETEDPCARVKCDVHEICVPREVQCIRAPCPPIAECVVPKERAKRQVSSEPTTTCKINELYMTCGGCESQCGQPQLFCTAMCRPAGCYCPSGFSRNSNGDCVQNSECSMVDDSEFVPPTEPNPCNLVDCPTNHHCVPLPINCLRGPCQIQGRCLPLTTARSARNVVKTNSTKCAMNEVYETCGYCEGTCDNRHPTCPSGCEKPGCYCPRGFIRDKTSGRCLHETLCDPTWRFMH